MLAALPRTVPETLLPHGKPGNGVGRSARRCDRPGRRREPHRVEGFGDCVRCRLDVVDICRISRFDVADDRLNPTLGELLDCRVSADFTELPHRGSRQIVVGVAEAAAAGRGDLELLGGTTSSALTQRRRRSGTGFAGLDQRIQVTSDTCALKPRRVPISEAVMGPSSSSSLTTAARVWPSTLTVTGFAAALGEVATVG